MDTPVVNGTAYPKLEVDPKAYRFRILNAANDRFLNLGLYIAADKNSTDPVDPTTPYGQPKLCNGKGSANNQVPVANCTEVKMVHFDTSYPAVYGAGSSSFPTSGGPTDTGWGTPNAALFPMGVPDPATAGPNILQIGNEAGLLANVHEIPSTIINYEYNKRSVTVLGVQEHGLYLGTAERADVVIDFSKYAGQTLILYNDAPAPVPASDPRIDYYTGNDDNTGAGGAPRTKPGYGPNTRTVMQIVVKKITPQPELNVPALKAALPEAYASVQAKPIVPEPEFNNAFPGIATSVRNNARIYTGTVYLGGFKGMSFKTPEAINYFPAPTCSSAAACNTAVNTQQTTPAAPTGTTVVPNGKGLVSAPAGSTVSAFIQNKAIQELFDPTYGRMNATLGIELPFTSALTQTTIPLAYVDPVTETVADGETQFWKITHNGVDTHPVHFHLVNVQVINRIGWDGTIKVPYGDESGWKETVKMNPLEDVVVAVRAKKPTLTGVVGANGFGLPLSKRLMDPSQPIDSTLEFTPVNPATGNPMVVKNAERDYGWEYAWHCHILGHEENDFMRPVKFDANEVMPAAPSNLTINGGALSWIDNATTEYEYTVERALVTNGVIGAYSADLTEAAPQIIGSAPLANATHFTDTTLSALIPSNNTAPLVRATDVGLNSVTLNWPANNELGYKVFRSPSPAGLDSFVEINPVTGTTATYTDSSVSPSTQYTYTVVPVSPSLAYSYRVTAIGAKGSSSVEAQSASAFGASATATIDVTTASPTVVAAPTALVVDSTLARIRLIWTDVAVAPQIAPTTYSIQRASDGVSFATIATVGATVRAYNNIATGAYPIALGNTYTYRVIGQNATATVSSSAPSNGVTVQYSAPAIPSVPNQGATTTTTVALNWPAVPNATRYTVFRNGVQVWNGTALSRTQGGEIAGNTYNFTVTASNALGSSANSAALSVTMVPVAPAIAPTATLGAVGSKKINLALPALPTGATGFNVIYQTRANALAAWSALTTLPNATGITGTTYQTTALAAGQYRFRVAAVNTSGISVSSPSSAIVTAP